MYGGTLNCIKYIISSGCYSLSLYTPHKYVKCSFYTDLCSKSKLALIDYVKLRYLIGNLCFQLS